MMESDSTLASDTSETERPATPKLNPLKRAAPSDRKGVAPIKPEYVFNMVISF